MRNSARELNDLLAPADLAKRVGKHLAVFGGNDRRQLLFLRVQQLTEAEQNLRALGQRHVAPLRKRGLSRGDDFVDVVFRGERELCCDLTGRRISDVGKASAVALEDLARFPVVKSRCHVSSYLVMLLKCWWMIMILCLSSSTEPARACRCRSACRSTPVICHAGVPIRHGRLLPSRRRSLRSRRQTRPLRAQRRSRHSRLHPCPSPCAGAPGQDFRAGW